MQMDIIETEETNAAHVIGNKHQLEHENNENNKKIIIDETCSQKSDNYKYLAYSQSGDWKHALDIAANRIIDGAVYLSVNAPNGITVANISQDCICTTNTTSDDHKILITVLLVDGLMYDATAEPKLSQLMYLQRHVI